MGPETFPSGTPANPRQILLTTRIIWAAQVIGLVVFLIVVLAIRNPNAQTQGGEQANTVAYVAIGMLVVLAPVAFILRRAVTGAKAADGTVDPRRAMTGTIVFLALFDGVAFAGLVAFLLGAPLGLAAAIPAMLVQLISFPRASAIGADRI